MRDLVDARVHSMAVELSSVSPSARGDSLPGAASLGHLCAAVFSWALGEYGTKSYTDIYQLQASLLMYAQAGGREIDARPHARTGTILREFGLSRADVRELWREQRARDGYLASLSPTSTLH